MVARRQRPRRQPLDGRERQVRRVILVELPDARAVQLRKVEVILDRPVDREDVADLDVVPEAAAEPGVPDLVRPLADRLLRRRRGVHLADARDIETVPLLQMWLNRIRLTSHCDHKRPHQFRLSNPIRFTAARNAAFAFAGLKSTSVSNIPSESSRS